MILTDLEKAELQRIADNPPVIEILQKVFLNMLIQEYDLTNSNEDLGATLRARLEAKQTLERGFRELLNFKTENRSDSPRNIAR